MSNDAVGKVLELRAAVDSSSGAGLSDPGAAPIVHAEAVMGTVASFHIRPGAVGPEPARQALAAACQLLHQADDTFSTWQHESPISRFRRGEATMADMPAEVGQVFELCRQVKELSRGWFDPWSMPGGVDPTGLVKGWSLEQAALVLRAAGVEAALVNAGGDLVGFGRPSPAEPWRIGIRHPWIADGLACVVRLDAAMATSGTYERGPHLIDPHNGQPALAAASATVSGPSLSLCDGLATALAVGGADAFDAIDALVGYEAYVIDLHGEERSTDGMAFVD